MALLPSATAFRKSRMPQILCRKKEKDRGQNQPYPYKVIEITPPPKNLGVRCFPSSSRIYAAGLFPVHLGQPPSQLTRNKGKKSRCKTQDDLIMLNLQCGESVTIEGRAYMISAVTHRYRLRKGKYEPSEKRLDVLSTGRYIVNLYLENLLEKS